MLAASVDDLVPQAGGLRAETAFDAVEAELINNEQIEPGVKADAIVDGLVGQRSREVFEKSAAGDVVDFITQGTGRLADALDEIALPFARPSVYLRACQPRRSPDLSLCGSGM